MIEGLNFYINSHCECHRKCGENSVENIHTDDKVNITGTKLSCSENFLYVHVTRRNLMAASITHNTATCFESSSQEVINYDM